MTHSNLKGARHAAFTFAWLYLLLTLAGCGSAQSAPTPSAQPSLAPTAQATVTATATLAPTMTVTATLAPTLAPSQTPSPAPSATAPVAFDKAKVTGVRNQVGGVMVTLLVPNLHTVYNIILAGVRYTCNLDEEYPDRLFCWGLSGPPYNKDINLAFLDPATGAVVLEEKTFLPEADFAPPGKMTNNSENCANKGENQSCEVECRIDEAGNPCIVATCFDACGQTLSIQTCSSNLTDISFCTAEQLDEIKKRYNLP